MATPDSFENDRAAQEARDSVAARPASSHRSEVTSALQRYLNSESYRTLHEESGRSPSETETAAQDDD